MEIDLMKPAFGENAQKIEEVTPEATVEPAVVEPTKEEGQVESVEETKVSYSRFKKFHDRALDAEREAAEWRAKAESIGTQRAVEEPMDMDSAWVRLYGDSPESKEAYKLQQQREEALITRAEDRARETVQNERYEENRRIDKNVEILDESFEDLSALVGRDISQKEESAVLDIIDDYTPKDEQGNYLGAILPIEKAWEIYELKQQASKAPISRARNQVASLSNTSSQGDPGQTERDKNFDPRNWNDIKI